MFERLMDIGVFVAALGCGLVAGVFFAFSGFVMPALARLSPAAGIAAMQSINRLAVTAWFMSLLFGTALLCLVLALLAILNWHGALSAWPLAGSLLYLCGAILVTVLFNVPLNNALATAPAENAEGAAIWSRYLTAWTRWNHLRTVASSLAAGCFILGLRYA